MDLSTQRLMMGAAGSAAPAYVEDVFSTWLYTGTGSTQTITNGIDLSGKGGLVWIKGRSGTYGNSNHRLYDTARGATNELYSNLTFGQYADSTTLTSFSSSGFSVSTNAEVNGASTTFASWTFRKAAKFFDVVTYTGDDVVGRTVSHNLGSAPGCMIIKRTDTTGGWIVYHRSLGAGSIILLNSTSASSALGTDYWNNTAPTSTVFTLGGGGAAPAVNASGGTYVAYLFAHDAGGFGDSGNDSVVKCGSYTGNGGLQAIDLGWEPQWLLIKQSSGTEPWNIFDTMRGIATGGTDAYLQPNSSAEENFVGSYNFVNVTPTGFEANFYNYVNDTGQTYIYIAIRRGPMKTPTDATKVFESVARTSAGPNLFSTALAVVDMAWNRDRTSGASGIASTRLTGSRYLVPNSTAAEVTVTSGDLAYDYNYQINPYVWSPGNAEVNWLFRRAPGFFDVVAYTGTGVARTINHNLGVVPELGIFKIRSTTGFWLVYSQALGNNDSIVLQSDSPASGPTSRWDNTSPTNQVFTLGAGGPNASGQTYIGYLFASCPGVSKVGSYTGTGTTLQVNCGFTSGARFILIKRTDSTGDWYVWDSARGIVAGNDPYLLLNSTAAEVTGTDYVDTFSSGFEISSTAPAAINANGGSFIFLAVS